MVELAFIAPVLIMILMALIDFGRAAYIYATLSGAVRDGARMAALTGSTGFTDVQVVGQVKKFAIGLSLAGGACINGQSAAPLTPAPTGGNTGYVYVVSGSPLPNQPNAPMGQPAAGPVGSCAAVVPAYAAHAPLTVTVVYNFQPITPMAAQFLPQGIVMTVSSTMTTEY
jgi:Flp pilus assembly protein TadG